MHWIIALVSVFVLLNGKYCVSGLPTQPLEAALNYIFPTTEPLETCYGVETDDIDMIGALQESAVDSEERQCYAPIDKRIFRVLFNQTQFERNYANLTAETCSTWPQSKQCLFDHLNSDKCNEANRKQAKDAISVGVDVVVGEMLCNPIRPNYVLYLLKSTSDEGLWNCFAHDDVREVFMNCDSEPYDDNDRTFTSLSKYFECSKAGIRKCARGDAIKEVNLVNLWDEIDGALQESFARFWRQLND